VPVAEYSDIEDKKNLPLATTEVCTPAVGVMEFEGQLTTAISTAVCAFA
jgi:hypothetical protein